MKHFEQHSSFYDNIIRLNSKERENPLEVFEDFFNCCDLEKCYRTISDMKDWAFEPSNTIYDDGEERCTLIYFCKRIQEVLKAAWLLHQHSLPKKRRDINVQTQKLTEEEKKELIAVIQCFFRVWQLGNSRQILWNMLECTLIADNDTCNSAEERQHMLWLYRNLECVLEAGWVIAGK